MGLSCAALCLSVYKFAEFYGLCSRKASSSHKQGERGVTKIAGLVTGDAYRIWLNTKFDGHPIKFDDLVWAAQQNLQGERCLQKAEKRTRGRPVGSSDQEVKRQEFVVAVMKAIAEHGYKDVTVATICEAAGFSRGPLYLRSAEHARS